MSAPTDTTRTRLFRAGDLLLLLACVAAGLLCLLSLRGNGGRYAEVHTPTDTLTLDLSRTQTLHLSGSGGHTLTIETADGRVRVSEADCPDRLCVHTGWLQNAGQTAACLPAGIIVTVTGEKEDDAPDAVAY